MTVSADRLNRICEVLRGSSLFGVLNETVLRDLASCVEIQTIHGGSTVFREGDQSNSMLILLNGRLRVSRRDALGSLNLYNEIVPGESVGEAGMILVQPRTADVMAIRDSTLAVLHRAGFESLLVRHPLELNRVFTQAIYNHLRHTPQAIDRRLAESVVVVPLHPGPEASEVAQSLTRAFMKRGRARHISTSSEDGPAAADHAFSENDNEWFDQLERQNDFLVYEAEPVTSAWTKKAFREADQVIFVAASSAAPGESNIEAQLSKEPSFSLKRKHLALLHPAGTEYAQAVGEWRGKFEIERIYPLRSGDAQDFGRLARFLTSSAVGVVFGGGGARGFAHLGVLRALEEVGIPIDIIGGNSMGALIGAQYASGLPIAQILDQTRRFALGGEWPTVPVISLLSGRRIERDLRRMFGNMNIDALWRPFFAAACNLSRAATSVQDTGMLWRAVLASNSPAGLLPPVLHNGELLVDGAILDNVPVGAMRQRLGAPLEKRRGNGTIIAVDVDVQQDLGVHPETGRLSVWKSIKGHFPGVHDEQPGIGDILYRAGHIGGLHQRERTINLADHYLEPPVADFPLMGYRQAAEIAEVGYQYTMEKIREWDLQALRI